MTSLTPAGRRLRVAVLMGGTSSERPISLKTGNMIVQALDPARYEVVAIDTQDVLRLQGAAIPRIIPAHSSAQDGTQSTICAPPAPTEIALSAGTAVLANADPSQPSPTPDVVFIALHGKGGEDGTVQGMLELIGLPYTGSGVLASALAMDKAMTKRLFRSAGIPVIEDLQVRRGEEADGTALLAQVAETLGYPVFVKPNAEGSSFGGRKVEAPEELLPAVTNALNYDPKVIIERYVRGMEITVGVLGNAHDDLFALPIVEIVPKSAFYDFESKYADGGSEHIIPARLPESVTQHAQALALQCHNLLGCRGMSRTDMLVVGETLLVLEINTIPGMTPTSLLPQAAEHAGISFPQLLDRLLTSALEGRS